ncbi:hypothetical protein Rfer_4297 (plasmid) [Rhodoferax ferrireducens T118]|uniref:Uncharacterized protein n=1 Tax=Albidiferax ferrireducens (strain ATCC BAA-621 / DSM 15236 / T118) TaxID=338969 RepID=Q21QG2_ALBFT|nr:hypothetical protein [Rhodoferax ferrireducens]ABD71983.1 hypothetical protein Rfer_4297 [Rhodoferax ferrireducens T118]
MPLFKSTLSAIQKAGAAAFVADARLKSVVKKLSQQVNAAMVEDPFHLGNDSLFEGWKTVARLAQTMSGIEQEIQKVYQVASELSLDVQAFAVQIPALAAPTRSDGLSTIPQNDLAPTDVVIKKKTKASKAKAPAVAKTRVAKKARGSIQEKATAADQAPSDVSPKTKTASKNKAGPAKSRVPKVTVGTDQPKEPSGNSAKLLQHLQGVLNQADFIPINQTEIGSEIGVPLGSMTAAIKNLIKLGRIVAGPPGAYKLTTQ